MSFNAERYSRQTALIEIGPIGQSALARARVLVVGVGGLGSPILRYLAAAGVGLRTAGGALGAIDDDIVQLSNLQRQILFVEADCGTPKVVAASRYIMQCNTEIDWRPINTRLTTENAPEIFSAYDIIVDGTDNFETKNLINTAAVHCDKPMVYGSIFGFEGQSTVFWAKHGPCYRCLYPQLPNTVPNRVELGVFGGVPGMVGLTQMTSVCKLAMGLAHCQQYGIETLIGKLWHIDLHDHTTRVIAITRRPGCPICGSVQR